MKPILDVACGCKMFYFDKNDQRVLFCDKRIMQPVAVGKGKNARTREVAPDVQCDFSALPFADHSYHVVVFDPPHLTRNTGESRNNIEYGSLNEKAKTTGFQQIIYGALYVDWRDMLRKGFSECFRVLKPNGVLVFKWNETDIKVSEILALTPEKPVFGNRSGKASKTHWICFVKGDVK